MNEPSPRSFSKAVARVVEAFLTATELIEGIKTGERDRATRNPLRKIGKPKLTGAARDLHLALGTAANEVRHARHEVRVRPGQGVHGDDIALEGMSIIFSRIQDQVLQPLLNAMHETQPGGWGDELYLGVSKRVPPILADANKVIADLAARNAFAGKGDILVASAQI